MYEFGRRWKRLVWEITSLSRETYGDFEIIKLELGRQCAEHRVGVYDFVEKEMQRNDAHEKLVDLHWEGEVLIDFNAVVV